jgi:hypothetical protein
MVGGACSAQDDMVSKDRSAQHDMANGACPAQDDIVGGSGTRI